MNKGIQMVFMGSLFCALSISGVQSMESKEMPKETILEVTTEPIQETEPETINEERFTFSELNTFKYATTDIIVREQPEETAQELGIIQKDTEVLILRQCNETGWYEITYKETFGYLSPEFLSDIKPFNPNICQINGYVDQYYVDRINQELSSLPPLLLQSFIESGWNIYATDMNIDAVYYGSQFGMVMATTNYEEYRILVEDREDAVTEAPIHEFGHWFDWYLGYITDSPEFLNIYYSETAAFKSAFYVNFYYDNKELFAEGFWKYFTAEDVLASNCPQLYQFIQNAVHDYL